MDFIKQLNWRIATHHFSKKRIPKRTRHVLLESLRFSPSAYGLQPWKFVLVDDKELRQRLRAHSFDQPQVTEASDYIVLCARENLTSADIDAYIRQAAKRQHTTAASMSKFRAMVEKDVAKMTKKERMNWNARQVYIALGFLLATAAYLRIDTCPLEGFDAKAYQRLLGLKKTGFLPVVSVALGYRDPSRERVYKKVRFPQTRVFLRKK